jgi:hypothetical protein
VTSPHEARYRVARLRHAIIAGVVVLFVCSPASAQDDRTLDPTFEQIVAAWKAQHDAVHSFECTVEETAVHQPGALPGFDVRYRDDEGQPFPREELTLRQQHHIAVDGLRLYFDKSGDDWQNQAERVQFQRRVYIIDGDRAISFYGTNERSNRVYPRADIHSADVGSHPGTLPVGWPICHALRNQATGPWFGPFDETHWRLASRRESFQGRDCLVLEDIEIAKDGYVHEVWVDPQRDFCAVKRVLYDLALYEITAFEHEASVWIPVEWTFSMSQKDNAGHSRVMSVHAFKVTEFTLNEPVNPELFDFQFPVGTEVTDSTQGEPPLRYIVQAGRDRPITEDELLRGARYTDLVEAPAGEALAPPRRYSIPWPWVAAFLLAAAAGWWLVRRR